VMDANKRKNVRHLSESYFPRVTPPVAYKK
jgi:hypothetical protein